MPYHIRQLDETGYTTRQLTHSYERLAEAKAVAKREEHKTGDEYTVCESLEASDARNVKGEGRFGFIAVSEATEEKTA